MVQSETHLAKPLLIFLKTDNVNSVNLNLFKMVNYEINSLIKFKYYVSKGMISCDL